jgi:predicted chitinase
MAQIDSMLVNMEQDTQNKKDLILERLLKDNLITDAIAEQYATDWQVIINTNWFTRWSNKFKFKENTYKYRYVRF